MSGQVIQTEEQTPSIFTAHDRCDGCGAQAYVKVEAFDGEFLFCGHHWTKSKVVLEPVATSIHDETNRLR